MHSFYERWIEVVCSLSNSDMTLLMTLSDLKDTTSPAF